MARSSLRLPSVLVEVNSLEDQHGQPPAAGLPDLISPDGSEVWVLLNLAK
ncbi:MAG: hypothetical protein ABSH32_11545 [Bryobacteraceae bacterium]